LIGFSTVNPPQRASGNEKRGPLDSMKKFANAADWRSQEVLHILASLASANGECLQRRKLEWSITIRSLRNFFARLSVCWRRPINVTGIGRQEALHQVVLGIFPSPVCGHRTKCNLGKYWSGQTAHSLFMLDYVCIRLFKIEYNSTHNGYLILMRPDRNGGDSKEI